MDEFDKALIEAQDQKGESWRDIRCGRFTSSEIHKLLSDPRSKADKDAGKWSDGADTYINSKVAEQLTGYVSESPRTAAIVWGEDHEPFARELYEIITGVKVVKSGFTVYGDHAGGSPDGFVGDDIFLEIKCPYNSSNHIDYLKMKKAIELKDLHFDYWVQCQSNMIFTKRLCIFIAYDPRFPIQKQKLTFLEIGADAEVQDLIEVRIEKAIKTKLEIVSALS
jgi:exodeoxyribonuclease (lambda-induced)